MEQPLKTLWWPWVEVELGLLSPHSIPLWNLTSNSLSHDCQKGEDVLPTICVIGEP